MAINTFTQKTLPIPGSSFTIQTQEFLAEEDALRFKDLFRPSVVSGGTHGTAAGLVGTPAPLLAYPGGFYVVETGSITYNDDKANIWVAVHKDKVSAVTNWTRVAGTHYIFRDNIATQPAAPDDAILIMHVTTASGAITSVGDLRPLGPVTAGFKNLKDDFGATGNGKTLDDDAIDAALAFGGLLYAPAGTYLISSRKWFEVNGTTLLGEGSATIFKAADSAVAPDTMFASAAGHATDRITLKDLKLEGNGVLPASPGTAAAGIFLQDTDNIKVDNIWMTNFVGIGLVVEGGFDWTIANSRFTVIGEAQTVSTTGAIWTGGNSGRRCERGLIFNNYVDDVKFGSGINVFSSHTDVIQNKLRNIKESGIYSEYSSAANNLDPRHNKFIGNDVADCTVQDISATGLEIAISDAIIAYNIVQRCEGNGIGCGNGKNVVVSNNICFNNNRTAAGAAGTLDGAGIAIVSDGSKVNPDDVRGLTFDNNICYDDQGTKTQKYGYRTVVKNSGLYRDVEFDANNIAYDNLTEDFSIVNNTFWWSGLGKDFSSDSVTGTLVETNLKKIDIPANTLGLNDGFKITAWGQVTGTNDSKVIRLKFGTSGWATIAFTAGQTGDWKFVAEVFNNASFSSQRRSAFSYGNVVMQEHDQSTSAEDTTTDKSIFVTGDLAHVSDTITCDGIIVEKL
jgi:hypothetical protein